MSRTLAPRLALGTAVAALCVGGFFACFEKREVTITSPLAAEARRNRHLALARLLERMGHPVALHDDLAALSALPDAPATVILTSNRTTLGRARSEHLLDWVAKGGHLVVQTFTVWQNAGERGEIRVSGKPDLLLDRFGIRQREALDEPAPEDAAAPAEAADEPRAPPGGAEGPEDAEDERPSSWAPESAWAWFDEDAEPLELEFSRRFWWDDPARVAVWMVGGDAGVHLIEVAHGAGRISALTSEEPLLNTSIGDADHAEFVVRWLREGREGRAPVWIFFEEDWPSLFALLRDHAAPALIAGGALFALWLWRALYRFGPALPSPDPARRRWLEHLEAAGRFHWRQDRGVVLLAALRTEISRELERKRPAWTRLPERERMERLAHASGASLAEVAHALLGTARAPRSFAAAVRTLERLRAAL